MNAAARSALLGTAVLMVLGCAAAPAAPTSPASAVSPSASRRERSFAALSQPPSVPPGVTGTTKIDAKAPAGATRVTLGPNPGQVAFAYDPGTKAPLTLKAGTFVIEFMNPSIGFMPHDIAIGPELYAPWVSSDPVEPNHSEVFTVQNLPAGRYAFWCTVDGHAAQGMVGTLIAE
jgi:plastocyanin